MRVAIAVLMCFLALGEPSPPEDPGFVVVVSPSNRVSTASRRELARLFLKKTAQWNDGSSVAPVDQSARSVARAAFTRDVLKVEGLDRLSSVTNYWQQQLYAGRATPPPIKDGDAEVVAFVAQTPGAIGYVSTRADLHGVKPIRIDDQPAGGR